MVSRNRKAKRITHGAIALMVLFITSFAAYTHREYIIGVVIQLMDTGTRQGAYQSYENFGVLVPEGFQIHGIDVSHHQGRMDWKKIREMNVKGDSITFVFIKASEGKKHKDRKFESNWRHAKRQGLYKGAYHYYIPHVPSRQQAENFIHTVSLEPGDLPPVLDIEDESIYGSDNLRTGILNWLRIIETHYKVKPIIYTSAAYYARHLNSKPFEGYIIWIAHYRQGNPRISHDRWTFWQYTDRGKIDGCKQDVDLNVFKGNLIEFRKILIK